MRHMTIQGHVGRRADDEQQVDDDDNMLMPSYHEVGDLIAANDAVVLESG